MDTTTTTDIPTKGPIKSFLEACGQALLEPGKFFRERFSHWTLGQSLSFGVVSFWLASLVAFLWSSVNFIFLSAFFERWMQSVFFEDESFALFHEGPQRFLLRAGMLTLLPVFTVFSALFASLVLYFFARFLTGRGQEDSSHVNYLACIRIFAFALLGTWFLVVPIFGGLLAYLAFVIFAAVATRESFHVSSRRAALIVLMPQFMLFFVLSLLFTMMFVLLFSLPMGIELLDQAPF